MSEMQREAAVVVEREGKFFIYQPSLGVIASDERIDYAYRKFDEARRAFFQNMNLAGLHVPEPPDVIERRTSLNAIAKEAGVLLARMAVVLAVVFALFLGIALGVKGAVDGLVNLVAAKVNAVGPLSIKDVVVKAGDIALDFRDLNERQRESLQQSIGIISREVEPYVAAWRNPPPLPPPAAKPDASTVINRSSGSAPGVTIGK